MPKLDMDVDTATRIAVAIENATNTSWSVGRTNINIGNELKKYDVILYQWIDPKECGKPKSVYVAAVPNVSRKTNYVEINNILNRNKIVTDFKNISTP